jgi:DNA-binding NtrC family response regulator
MIGVEHIVGALRERERLDDDKDPRHPSQAPGVAGAALPASASAVKNGLQHAERNLILDVYTQSQRNVSVAARHLGMARTTLRDKLRKYGLR